MLLGKDLGPNGGCGGKKWGLIISIPPSSMSIDYFRHSEIGKMESITYECNIGKNVCADLLELIEQEIEVENEATGPLQTPHLSFSGYFLVPSNRKSPKLVNLMSHPPFNGGASYSQENFLQKI